MNAVFNCALCSWIVSVWLAGNIQSLERGKNRKWMFSHQDRPLLLLTPSNKMFLGIYPTELWPLFVCVCVWRQQVDLIQEMSNRHRKVLLVAGAHGVRGLHDVQGVCSTPMFSPPLPLLVSCLVYCCHFAPKWLTINQYHAEDLFRYRRHKVIEEDKCDYAENKRGLITLKMLFIKWLFWRIEI